jgi:hypothetical protein
MSALPDQNNLELKGPYTRTGTFPSEQFTHSTEGSKPNPIKMKTSTDMKATRHTIH